MVKDYRDLSQFETISPELLEEMIRRFDWFEAHYDNLGQATFAQLHFERLVANLDRCQQLLAELRACIVLEDAA